MTNSINIPQDMRDALNKFDKESNRIIDSEVATTNSPPSQLIYHYTDDIGLKGILETGKLWLSDIFSLNDPSELRHGVLQAVDILKARNGPNEIKQLGERFEEFSYKGGTIEKASFFICSFSSCGNDLCQWRAYADNGRGYALGFDGKTLEQVFKEKGTDVPEPPHELRNQIASIEQKTSGGFCIIYDDDRLDRLHKNIIEKMISLISPLSAPDQVKLLSTLASKVVLASLHFKHKAYSNEKEYRFLELHGKVESHQVRTRLRSYSLVRYREFDWKRTAAGTLRRIVVGPSADQRGIQFAHDCKRMFCANSVEVIQSRIPYRAL